MTKNDKPANTSHLTVRTVQTGKENHEKPKCLCPGWGSNSRPSDYETDALPTALRRHCAGVPKNFPCNKNVCTHGGTRTPNLRFRRPTPYPLGHAGTWCHECANKVTRRAVATTKMICVARESNPGRKNGNLAWYHYTSDAPLIMITKQEIGANTAVRIEMAPNLRQ